MGCFSMRFSLGAGLLYLLTSWLILVAVNGERCHVQKVRLLDGVLNPDQEWLPLNEFELKYIAGTIKLPVVYLEVSTVPCAARGCCTVTVAMRPFTTDNQVFRSVFTQQSLSKLYQQHLSAEYVVDGGANVGYATMQFALMYPDAKIIAIEPDPHNFFMLKANAARFPNVHLVHAGLWDKVGYLNLTFSQGDWGKGFGEVANHEHGAVHAITIPTLMEKHNFPRIDVAKIDIEGAEGRVFASTADVSWLDVTNVLCMELHDHLAHFYGMEQVSNVVHKAVDGRGFQSVAEGEHIFWARIKLDL